MFQPEHRLFVRFNHDNGQHIAVNLPVCESIRSVHAAAIARQRAAKAKTAERNCLPVIMSVNRGMAFEYTSCFSSLYQFVEKIRHGKGLTKREKLCILFYS